MAKLFSLDQVKESSEKATEAVKNLAYMQLGVYGKVYDEVNDFISAQRESTPKIDDLVERGTKVQDDMKKAQEELKSRVKNFDLKASVQEGVEQVKGTIEKIKGSVKKAA